MTLTDEEPAEIEARASFDYAGGEPSVLITVYERGRILSSLREERDEVKRLREALEAIAKSRDYFGARAALSQLPKEGKG